MMADEKESRGNPAVPSPPPLPVNTTGHLKAQVFNTARGVLKPVQLHFALNSGTNEDLRVLIKSNIELNYMFYGHTPLTLAIMKENEEGSLLLIRSGADVHIKEQAKQRSPIHIAAQNGRLAVLQELINHGANVHCVDSMGFTAMHYVCAYCSDVKLLNFLLEAGAHLNVKDDRGRTPLFRAAEAGSLDYVSILYDFGASVNIADMYGWTALHQSVICNNEAMCDKLISIGSDLVRCDHNGDTIMHAAVDRLSARNLQILAATSLNYFTRHRSPVSKTTIQATSYAGVNESLVYTLLNCGAAINQPNIFGQTPLLLAAQSGHVTVMKMLIGCGANLNKESWISNKDWPPSLEDQESLCTWISEIAEKKVVSLKELSKFIIRGCISPYVNQKISLLPLPTQMIAFLDILTD